MDSQNCTNLELEHAPEVVKVTKDVENECRSETDKNNTTSGDTMLSPSCDINFPRTSEVTDYSGYQECDKIDNKTFPPVKQETINISGVNEENVDLSVDSGGTTDKISDTSQEISMETINATDKNTCTSPVIKKIKINIQSPNESLEEVVDKVKKLDIVEKPKTKSEVIVKNQTSSLRNLLLYHSESSDIEDEDFEANWQLHGFHSSSISSEGESNSQDCVEISEDEGNSGFVLPTGKHCQKKQDKQDFEPIEPPPDLSNLQIDYDNEQFLHIGHISNFINSTVTIDAIANSDSYNLETVLFIDDKTSKRPLGAICDVIGPVYQPVYCLQLQNAKEVETLGLKEGMKVYSAPKSEYTKFVFLKDLLRMKGTDASWVGDEEPPSDEADTSDDELDTDERSSRKRAHNNSLERHKQFENAKNRCNIIKSQVANMFDKYRQKPRAQNIHMFPHGFNPNVPPPNMQPSFQNNVSVAPLPSPRQQNLRRRLYANSPQLRGPYFEYHYNAAGPSHQNHY